MRWHSAALTVFTAIISLPAGAPAEPVRGFILAGQSNMDGRPPASLLPAEFQRPQSDVLFFWKDAWTALEPGSTLRPRPEMRFGPEISFGRDMADTWASQQIAIVKHTAGGSSLAVDWKAGSGPHYLRLVEKVAEAGRQLARQGRRLQIDALVWMQGERDAGNEEWASVYEPNLREFIARLRSDLAMPQLPIVMGQIYAPTDYYPHREMVKQAQARIAGQMPRVRLVPTADLRLQDDVHYDAPSVLILGRRFAYAVRDMLKEEGAGGRGR